MITELSGSKLLLVQCVARKFHITLIASRTTRSRKSSSIGESISRGEL